MIRNIDPGFLSRRFYSVFLETSLYWAAKQQISWVIAPWWIFIPSGSLLLPAPSRPSEHHLHFASIKLCQAFWMSLSLLFYSWSIVSACQSVFTFLGKELSFSVFELSTESVFCSKESSLQKTKIKVLSSILGKLKYS